MVVIYLYENVIQYLQNKKIHEFTISKKAMQYGKIKNIPLFEKELHKLIKKEKWVTFIHSISLKIILPIHYEETDKELLTILLNNNGIKKISYLKEENLLSCQKDQMLIELHQNYFLTYKNEKINWVKFCPLNIFQKETEAMRYLFKKEKNQTSFLFFGSNSKIPSLINKIQKKNCLYYNNYKTYLLENFTLQNRK